MSKSKNPVSLNEVTLVRDYIKKQFPYDCTLLGYIADRLVEEKAEQFPSVEEIKAAETKGTIWGSDWDGRMT